MLIVECQYVTKSKYIDETETKQKQIDHDLPPSETVKKLLGFRVYHFGLWCSRCHCHHGLLEFSLLDGVFEKECLYLTSKFFSSFLYRTKSPCPMKSNGLKEIKQK